MNVRRGVTVLVLGLLVSGLLLPGVGTAPAEAAFPVIDGANLSQNILTALRSLEAIRQRILVIRNQIAQIEWMVKNVQDLDEPTFRQVAGLLRDLGASMERQTRGLVYTLRRISDLFEEIYPSWEPAGDLLEDEERRAVTTLDTLRAALISTQRMAEDFEPSQRILAAMRDEALATEGHLEIFQSQALLEAFQAEEVSKLLQQVAVLTNLVAVGFAHEVSSRTAAEQTFREALEKAYRGAPAYEAVAPVPVVPRSLPRRGRP